MIRSGFYTNKRERNKISSPDLLTDNHDYITREEGGMKIERQEIKDDVLTTDEEDGSLEDPLRRGPKQTRNQHLQALFQLTKFLRLFFLFFGSHSLRTSVFLSTLILILDPFLSQFECFSLYSSLACSSCSLSSSSFSSCS